MPAINYPMVASWAFNTPLLATAQVSELVTEYLKSRMFGGEAQQLATGSVDYHECGTQESPAGIAVAPVHGVLVPRRGQMAGQCTEIMSYELLRNQLNRCLKDDDVKEIVLDINSGGGSAQGAFEVAEYIYQAKEQKKITALVNHNAYSGAYLIAAACSEIVLSDTSGVGSIGVYTKRLDLTKHYEQQGAKIHTFFKGAKKVDYHPDIELSTEESARIESDMQVTYDKFVDAVVKYRGMDRQDVLDTQAGKFNGQSAIDLGLADRLSTAQDELNQIALNVQKTVRKQTKQISIQAAAMRMQSQL